MKKGKIKTILKDYWDGFLQRYENKIRPNAKAEIKYAKTAAKYVGRYVGRPAIAESRILKYDGENVTYKYIRHGDNKIILETVHVYEFIKMIDKKILYIRKSIANWENRILAITGVDPCKCPNCGNKMRFYEIVYPKYGSMREWLRLKIISDKVLINGKNIAQN